MFARKFWFLLKMWNSTEKNDTPEKGSDRMQREIDTHVCED